MEPCTARGMLPQRFRQPGAADASITPSAKSPNMYGLGPCQGVVPPVQKQAKQAKGVKSWTETREQKRSQGKHHQVSQEPHRGQHGTCSQPKHGSQRTRGKRHARRQPIGRAPEKIRPQQNQQAAARPRSGSLFIKAGGGKIPRQQENVASAGPINHWLGGNPMEGTCCMITTSVASSRAISTQGKRG